MIILHSYWRSTAAYRVRAALNLKGIDYELRSVHLVRDGGEQHQPEYRETNPQGLVPTLDYQGDLYTQSLAIMELLEEKHPEPPLLPAYPTLRARARQYAQLIGSDIHPLNNLRVLQYLKGEMGLSQEQSLQWYRHWVAEGFTALEALLERYRGDAPFAVTDEPGVADICIVSQVYNAHRFDCDMSDFPRIREINDRCMELDAFQRAAPENQPDAA